MVSGAAKQDETILQLKTTPLEAKQKEGKKAGLGESLELHYQASHKTSLASRLFNYLSQYTAFLILLGAHLNCRQQEELY